jgi:hypothetical protein
MQRGEHLSNIRRLLRGEGGHRKLCLKGGAPERRRVPISLLSSHYCRRPQREKRPRLLLAKEDEHVGGE